MAVRKIMILNDGFFYLDMGMLVWMKPSYYGLQYRCALKSLLVLTDDDRILIDTGAGDLTEEMMKRNMVEKEGNLLWELKGQGLAPDDITLVINTHLHFDHCGWNRSFKEARFIVQKDELRHAHNPHRFQTGGYYKPNFEGLDFHTVEGDHEVVEGVNLISTPGHTPGHQSVSVELGKRTYIFCGDCGPLKENIEKRNVIGITTDPVQCLESIDRLRAMEGSYIYAHDNEQLTLDEED